MTSNVWGPLRNWVRRDSVIPASCQRTRLSGFRLAKSHADAGIDTARMPTHQAAASQAWLPIGVPIHSPRIVSMIGVNGWCSANHAASRHRVGRHERRADVGQEHQDDRERVRRLGLPASSPTAAASHEIARMNSTMTAMRRATPAVSASGRQPTAAPRRSPARRDEVAEQAGHDVADQHRRAGIGIERKRSTMPLVMSCATADRGRPGAEPGAQHDQPGHDVVDVAPPVLIAPPKT